MDDIFKIIADLKADIGNKGVNDINKKLKSILTISHNARVSLINKNYEFLGATESEIEKLNPEYRKQSGETCFRMYLCNMFFGQSQGFFN